MTSSGSESLYFAINAACQWCRQEKPHVREPEIVVPYWYLWIIGVDPERQGRGVGRRLIDPVLRRADREGKVVFLETENRENLEFYQKFGFEEAAAERVPGSEVMMWSLRRMPAKRR